MSDAKIRIPGGSTAGSFADKESVFGTSQKHMHKEAFYNSA